MCKFLNKLNSLIQVTIVAFCKWNFTPKMPYETAKHRTNIYINHILTISHIIKQKKNFILSIFGFLFTLIHDFQIMSHLHGSSPHNFAWIFWYSRVVHLLILVKIDLAKFQWAAFYQNQNDLHSISTNLPLEERFHILRFAFSPKGLWMIFEGKTKFTHFISNAQIQLRWMSKKTLFFCFLLQKFVINNSTSFYRHGLCIDIQGQMERIWKIQIKTVVSLCAFLFLLWTIYVGQKFMLNGWL